MALAVLLAFPAHAAEEMVRYDVRAGDNLFNLARDNFRNIGDYKRVQTLNRIVYPRRIPIHRILLIPRSLLRFDLLQARVITFRGDARLLHAGRFSAIGVGTMVQEGDEIVTGPGAFVSLSQPDASIVTLPTRSHVRVARLRKWALIDATDRVFQIVSGRVRGIVTPLKGPMDNFRFETPNAVSAVRGTELRVAYDPSSGRSTTEVLEGHVEVSNTQSKRLVDPGQGVATAPSDLGPIVPLLPAPNLVQPNRVQKEADLAFTIEPVAGARAYHVQIARDAGFIDTLEEAETATLQARLPSIDDGLRFVRISAIDQDGLEGLPHTYSFRRRENIVSTQVHSWKVGKYVEYLFRWHATGKGALQYRFQLMRDDDGTQAVIDEIGLTGDSLVVTDLPPGRYRWRVQTLQFIDGEVNETWSGPEDLTISRVNG